MHKPIFIILWVMFSLPIAGQVSERYVKIAQKRCSAMTKSTPVFNKLEQAPEGTIAFSVNEGTEHIGYMVVARAKSRFNNFEFFVLFDTHCNKTQLVEIINYPETHGRKITSKSWLNKFGSVKTGELHYGTTIDAVSGATISARSLIERIKELSSEMQQKTLK
jgi:Na+-translocating ferredoxin:NAD+ oxidoreductase RnfG subunit